MYSIVFCCGWFKIIAHVMYLSLWNAIRLIICDLCKYKLIIIMYHHIKYLNIQKKIASNAKHFHESVQSCFNFCSVMKLLAKAAYEIQSKSNLWNSEQKRLMTCEYSIKDRTKNSIKCEIKCNRQREMRESKILLV